MLSTTGNTQACCLCDNVAHSRGAVNSGILLGILCHVVIAIPLLLSVPMVLETMARGDLAFRVHLQVNYSPVNLCNRDLASLLV